MTCPIVQIELLPFFRLCLRTDTNQVESYKYSDFIIVLFKLGISSRTKYSFILSIFSYLKTFQYFEVRVHNWLDGLMGILVPTKEFGLLGWPNSDRGGIDDRVLPHLAGPRNL